LAACLIANCINGIPLAAAQEKLKVRGEEPTQDAAPDSLIQSSPADSWWDSAWLVHLLGTGGNERLLSTNQLRHSAALTLSDLLAAETPIGNFRAGSHGVWDLPYLISPAVERLSLWFQDIGTTGAAFPEATTHSLSLLPVSELHYIAPDPILDPLGAGGDGMLYAINDIPNWKETPSAIRLSEAPNGTSVEDAYLAKQVDPWRLLTSLSHLGSDGRVLYGGTKYQHLMMQLERVTRRGAFRVVGWDRSGKYHLSGYRKQTWESRMLSFGWQYATFREGEGEFRVVRRNERLRWFEPDLEAVRRTISTEMTVQSAFPAGPISLVTSQAISWTSLAYQSGEKRERVHSRLGTGTAIGAVWEDAGSRAMVSLGRTDPWWDQAFSRGRFAVGRNLGRGLSIDLAGWFGGAPLFEPGLEPRGMTRISDGINLPNEVSLINKEQRRIRHLEMSGNAQYDRVRLRAALFQREIKDGLGLVSGVEDQSMRSDLTLRGATCSWDLALPYGSRLTGDLTTVLDPVYDDLPYLVAPYRARVVFEINRLLCQDELDLAFRLICEFQGKWQTEVGQMPATNRLNGELHGTIGKAHIFVGIYNLEDDLRESSTYSGGWLVLPVRNFRSGVEWHFLD